MNIKNIIKIREGKAISFFFYFLKDTFAKTYFKNKDEFVQKI